MRPSLFGRGGSEQYTERPAARPCWGRRTAGWFVHVLLRRRQSQPQAWFPGSGAASWSQGSSASLQAPLLGFILFSERDAASERCLEQWRFHMWTMVHPSCVTVGILLDLSVAQLPPHPVITFIAATSLDCWEDLGNRHMKLTEQCQEHGSSL